MFTIVHQGFLLFLLPADRHTDALFISADLSIISNYFYEIKSKFAASSILHKKVIIFVLFLDISQTLQL